MYLPHFEYVPRFGIGTEARSVIRTGKGDKTDETQNTGILCQPSIY